MIAINDFGSVQAESQMRAVDDPLEFSPGAERDLPTVDAIDLCAYELSEVDQDTGINPAIFGWKPGV